MPEASRLAAGVERIGRDAERRFGRATSTMGRQMAQGLDSAGRQAVSTFRDIERQQTLVTKAAKANADAQGRVRVALAGVEDVSRKANATTRQRVSADEALSRAQRTQKIAATDLTRQTKLLNTVQAEVRRGSMLPMGRNAFSSSFVGVRREASSTGAFMESALGGGMARAARFGSRALVSAVRNAGMIGGGILGLGGGALGVQALSGGWKRLATIQDAQVSMRTLLGDVQQADQLVSAVTDKAQGTPYSADQFLGMARTLTAMGVAAEGVPQQIEAIANATAASGRGPETLEQLAMAFGKVASQGKITGGEILSLSQAGVPALKILANTANVSADAMRKMITEGKTDGAEWALESLTKGIMEGTDGLAGATRGYGGVMQNLRETVSGSIEVFKAQRNILGAEFLRPLFDRLPDQMNRLSDQMKNLRPIATDLGNGLADGLDKFLGWVQSPEVQTAFGMLRHSIVTAKDALMEIAPAALGAAKTIGMAVGGYALGTWNLIADTLKAIAPLLNAVTGAIGGNGRAVAIAVAAWAAWQAKAKLLDPTLRAVHGTTGRLRGVWSDLRGPLRDTVDSTTGLVRQTGLLTRANEGAIGPIGQMRLAFLQGSQQATIFARENRLSTENARALKTQMTDNLPVFQRMGQRARDASTHVRSMSTVMGAAQATTRGLSIAAGGLVTALGGLWGIGLMGLTAAIGVLGAKHAEAAAAAEEHKRREEELRATLDEDTGRITEETRKKAAERFTEKDQYGTSVSDRLESYGLDRQLATDAATSTGDPAAYGEIRSKAVETIDKFMRDGATDNLKQALAAAGVESDELTNALLREGNGWDIVSGKMKAYFDNTDNNTVLRATLMNGLQGLIDAMPDATESIVTATQEVNKWRRENGSAAEKQREFNRTLHGTWEATEAGVEHFRRLGAAITETPNDKAIVVTVDNAEAFEALDKTQYQVLNMEDGTVKIIPLTDEAKAEFEQFVRHVENTPAKVPVGVDTDPAKQDLDQFLKSLTGLAPPKVPVNVAPNLDNLLAPGITIPPRARGGIYDVWDSVASFADGKLPQQALIQRPAAGAGLVQWAEPSTHGEAFIPLSPANRARSQAIWMETGRRLGMMRSFAQGGLNPGAAYVSDLIQQMYPQITDVGGWRPEDGFGEHSSGNAIDVMIPNWNTPQGKALGDAVAAFALTNAQALGLTHVLWQQRSFGPGDRTGSPMEDRGSPTQNHYDHVHLFMNKNGGQLPSAPLVTTGGMSVGSGGFGSSSASRAQSRRLRDAQQKVDDKAMAVTSAEQALAELDTKEKVTVKQRTDRENALAKAQREHQDALEDLTDLQMDIAEKGADGGSGSGRSGPDTKNFAQEAVKGAFGALGLDGEIFSDPTQWGIWKLFTGGANYVGGLLKGAFGGPTEGGLWGSMMNDQHGMGGRPGPGNFGVGDGGLGGMEFGDPGSAIGSTLGSFLPQVSDFLPNSQSGKSGDTYTTNQNSNNTTSTGQAFNAPVIVNNNYGSGQQPPRGNTLTTGLPKVN
ncbi:tape measure protein [Mycolicibacterium sp.]|uniref:tape measure protein n=1 Tax=Mycolicibacterium sp. TaxID=2320850 RepID=UPI0037C722D7